MKALHSLFCAAALVVPAAIQAQEKSAPKYKCDMKVTIDTQKTPDLQAGGVKPKRSTARDWVELEVQMKFDAATELRNKPEGKMIPGIQVKYYVYLDAPTKDGKKILTGEVSYSDVAVGENVFGIVFIHPNTIKKLTGSFTVNPAAVKMYGVEVLVGGESVGIESSTGKGEAGKFWVAKGNAQLPPTEAGLLQKSKTPFAPFWGDRHLQEAAQ